MSPDLASLVVLRERVVREWRDNIAPFWSTVAVDDAHGGFRGWIANDGTADDSADKGVILNARILWTFSRAFRLYGDASFRRMATRAYDYFVGHFFDADEGGVFWSVAFDGRPSDTRKRSYAQAFALYAIAEYSAAFGDSGARDQALDLFDLLEDRCRDAEHDGYFETFERDWTLADDQRLSEVDRDDAKSMNAHLHVLEAYSLLAAVGPGDRVRPRLRTIIDLMLGRVLAGSSLRMFFDAAWQPTSRVTSFGHDIEASWLLCEAAEALGDPVTLSRVRGIALRMALAVYERAFLPDGSLHYEAENGSIIDDQKPWWVQTEAIVGFVNAYQLGGNAEFLDAAMRAWDFTDRQIVDRERGEWFWLASHSNARPKVSQWKCPYHNGRMCFEIDRRLGEILEEHDGESE